MSLERRDIRAYLDAEVHQALTAICNRRGISVADFVEALVAPEVLRICHEAIELEAAIRGLGIIRKNPERGGDGRK